MKKVAGFRGSSLILVVAAFAVACSSDSGGSGGGSEAGASAAGSTGTGGHGVSDAGAGTSSDAGSANEGGTVGEVGGATTQAGDAGASSKGGASARGGSSAVGGTSAMGGVSSVGGSSARGGSSAVGGTTGQGGAPKTQCDGDCACGNGIDDDGDGLVDGLDPECTTIFDNDEGSFATGMKGDNMDNSWQDCFFDGDSGAGNDGCKYRTECLTGELTGAECDVSDTCLKNCQPAVPSGCDCFGCCEVTPNLFVRTLGTCSMEKIEDEQACPRCVQSTSCFNDCGECELCAGRTEADLAELGCDGYTCDEGVQACTESSECTGALEFCVQGCCISALG